MNYEKMLHSVKQSTDGSKVATTSTKHSDGVPSSIMGKEKGIMRI